MASKKLVKKLVKMVEEDNLLDQNGENQMEEKPLELYELEEFAKRRVLLRKSYKIHFLVYIIVNGFLFYINWREVHPVESIFRFWAYMPMLIWGIVLWIHGVFVVTNNIKFLMGRSLQRKIFIIVSLSLLYLTLMAPMLNYLINAFSDNTDIWWYYVDILIVVFIMVYWYTVREINEPKLNEKITSEIKKIKKEYVEHKIKENEQKEKLEKRKMKK